MLMERCNERYYVILHYILLRGGVNREFGALKACGLSPLVLVIRCAVGKVGR